jgi:hypothetical protein
MDPANLSAVDSGTHRPGTMPDASRSDDASSTAPMDDGGPAGDESQGHDPVYPEAGPVEAGPVEASDGVDAPSGGDDGSASCSNAVTDLSNIGTGDFHVSFRIQTSQTGWVALLDQRSACTSGQFWDIRLCAPDTQKRCAVAGSVLIETSSTGEYTFLDSKVAINDGLWHDVAVARASGVLTIAVDGAIAGGSAPSKANFASLPAKLVGNDACVGHDGTNALKGTLSDLCITTP